MKLSDWAKAHQIPYRTAWMWFRNGNLPVPAKQLKSGTILVDAPHGPITRAVTAYARGSSTDAVDGHVSAAVRYATNHGMAVTRVITEILPDEDDEGRKFEELLRDNNVNEILVVEGTYVQPKDPNSLLEARRKLTLVPIVYS